jgi:type III restriction enzyme
VRQVVIENPVLNSPYEEPRRHFKFTNEGITDEIIDERRISSYFVPIAQPRRRGRDKQLVFETEWTKDREEENRLINQIRARVKMWREGGYIHITKTTRRLLEYWTNPDRDKKLFFCQIETVETAIYITEAANKCGDGWIENNLRKESESYNPGLYRIAFKMATGSGKTIVMAMLIAWQTLNKLANSQDARFSDAFLIVTPGITIRDRLRVLLPNDPNNYYKERDLLPVDMVGELHKAKIIITNFHAFLRREKIEAGKLTKKVVAQGDEERFLETPEEMARRVCRELGRKKNIVVINDEAHHCYRHRPDGEEVKLTGDDKEEAKRREKAAMVWLSGLEAVKNKIGVKMIYDLSATPFFLRGSGYGEGTLFPWVVSDFSLIDAIESGIVKVPRVPVADDSMTGRGPVYRDIWGRIREHLPRKGRRTEEVTGEPKLPAELEGALRSLYGNYEKYYRDWENNKELLASGATPPVFIVVCNNTNVSKLVYDWIAGWEKSLEDGSTVIVPGALEIFSNVEDGQWTVRPSTILIDSEQLESGEAMSRDFKKMAAREIEEFKSEYRIRFPGRDPEKLTDEDLLREVMNTVGKRGKLGENIKCVVSVSMLTEGWDANTVSHILGVRAFSTQLLCEQVIGRGLRRTDYIPELDGMFRPQYAEVYGVPFSFIPCAGSTTQPKVGHEPTHVRALPERFGCEITFPRVSGYRYEMPAEKLTANFTDNSMYVLSTQDIPSKTENAPIVGEMTIHTLDDLKKRREQEVAFLLAKLTLEKFYRDDEGNVKQWVFPQLLDITRQWLSKCVQCKDNTFPQMLLLMELAYTASEKIYKSIIAGEQGQKILKPILEPYNTVGSTKYVDFNTTRPVYSTDARFCHVSHVVADTESWEQKMAQALEELGEEGILISYVKNQQLGFYIPYTLAGDEHHYMPDFIARINDGKGKDDLLNLIIEVTGERDKEKEAKVATAKSLWIPAINNHGEFSRWAFLEISDPWDAKNTIKSQISNLKFQI